MNFGQLSQAIYLLLLIFGGDVYIHTSTGTPLREGDRVKFRCDSFGRPIFRESGVSNWNSGVITKVMCKDNPFYCMTITLYNGQLFFTAANQKNWPLDFGRLLVGT